CFDPLRTLRPTRGRHFDSSSICPRLSETKTDLVMSVSMTDVTGTRCRCTVRKVASCLHSPISSALICDLLKGSPIRDGDRCSLDTHPTRSLPFVQTFIHALSCRSNDVSPLALGPLNPSGGAAECLDIGHPKQRLGESYRQLLHGYFSHLPVGRTQPVTKHLDHPGPHVGVSLEEFQHIASVQYGQDAGRH